MEPLTCLTPTPCARRKPRSFRRYVLDPARALVKDAVRGQYDEGHHGPAYRHELDVAPDSVTETFIACKFGSTTGAGPACLSICEPASPWRRSPGDRGPLPSGLRLFSGTTDVEKMNPVRWSFASSRTKASASKSTPSGLDSQARNGCAWTSLTRPTQDRAQHGLRDADLPCMIGDATCFSAPNIEAGWAGGATHPRRLGEQPTRDFPNYVAGGSGPEAAAELLARDGRAWRPLA